MARCSPTPSNTSAPPQAKAGVVQNALVSGRTTAPVVPRMMSPLPERVLARTSNTLVPPPSVTLLPMTLVASGMKPFFPMVTPPATSHAARSALMVGTLFSFTLRRATNVGPPSHCCPEHVSRSVHGLWSSQLLPSGRGVPGMQAPVLSQVAVPLHALPSSQLPPTGTRQLCVVSLQTFWHTGRPAHGSPVPTHVPPWQVSVTVQKWPSLHEVPLARWLTRQPPLPS